MGESVFGPEIFGAGRRSRFKRIGFVSLVVVAVSDDFDDINNRLVIDGAEQGNEISIEPLPRIQPQFSQFVSCRIYFSWYNFLVQLNRQDHYHCHALFRSMEQRRDCLAQLFDSNHQ